MNKRTKIILGALIVGATTLYAADNSAGTSNDPLVTKSYVDSKIAAITNGGTGSTDVKKELEAQEQLIVTLMQEIENLKAEQNSTYQVVTVPAGQTLYGSQGTEVIVRSGEAEVVASEAGGLQDMTQGTDLNGGQSVPKYHLLIIPREDGRGITAVKKLTLMVRGAYTIE